jgi:hypothetical protein
MAENENEKLPAQLTDEELEEANGGDFVDNLAGIGDVEDSKGRVIGNYVYGVLKYSPCPNCTLPLHDGAWYDPGMYCDKCDKRYSGTTTVVWTGTKEQLIEFANKNI